MERTSISFDSIITQLRIAQPLETVVVLDTCRSTLLRHKGTQANRPFQEAGQLTGPGMVVIYSCQVGERSYESDTLKAGLFTEVLLHALGESGACTTIRDLTSYVRRELPLLSRAYDKPLQTPYFVLENAALNDMIIVDPSIYIRRRRSLILKSEFTPTMKIYLPRFFERPSSFLG